LLTFCSTNFNFQASLLLVSVYHTNKRVFRMSMLKLVRLAVTASLAAVSFGLVSGLQLPEKASAQLQLPAPGCLNPIPPVAVYPLDNNGVLTFTCDGSTYYSINYDLEISNVNGRLVKSNVGGFASTSNSCFLRTSRNRLVLNPPTASVYLECRQVLQPDGSYKPSMLYFGTTR
jgi:hypothetical protein